MTAAKALISLVTRAVAVEKAPIRVARSHSSTVSTARPAQCTWNPKPTPTATTTASNTVIVTRPDSRGPNRMANRLAGVTRSRSIRPDCSSKMVPKPALEPLAKASRARIPGRKICSTPPVGNPRTPGRLLSSGVNSTRYRIGVENPTTSQTGLRSICTM